MFDADKGLVHFAFANEDSYIRKSFLLLDRQSFLYSELKEKNYEKVIFIDITANDYKIVCGDSLAAQMFEKCQKKEKNKVKELFGRIFAETPKEEKYSASSKTYAVSREDKQQLINMIDQMMMTNRRTAFVFSIEAMASFQGIEAAKEMLVKHSKENYEKSNLVLIVSATELRASFDRLINRDGIFQSEAFPELREICQYYSDVRLYTKMEDKMPYRISYLNHMKRDEIRSLLILTILQSDNNVKAKLMNVEDYTDFLWLMIHSAKFANQMKRKNSQLQRIFKANDRRRFSVLKEILENQTIYETMDCLIKMIREGDLVTSLKDLVSADDKGNEYQVYIYQNNPVHEKLNSLTINDITSKKNGVKNSQINEIEKTIAEICKEIVKPHVISDTANHKKLEEFIREAIEYVIKADVYCDYKTMKIGVDAIHYAVCKCEKEILNSQVQTQETSDGSIQRVYKGQEICIQSYKDALKVQQCIGEEKRKIQEYEASVNKLNDEINEIIKQIQEMQKRDPDIENKSKQEGVKTVMVEKYNSLKMEGRALRNNMKVLKAQIKPINMSINNNQETVGILLGNISSAEDSEHMISLDILNVSLDEAQERLEMIDKNKNSLDCFYEKLKQSISMLERNEDLEFDGSLAEFDAEWLLYTDEQDPLEELIWGKE